MEPKKPSQEIHDLEPPLDLGLRSIERKDIKEHGRCFTLDKFMSPGECKYEIAERREGGKEVDF